MDTASSVPYHERNVTCSGERLRGSRPGAFVVFGVSIVVMKVCNVRGCPALVEAGAGRCEQHRRKAEARRGSAWSRGYRRGHRLRFREGVLAKNPICVLCMRRPATDADHYPHSRIDLVEMGLDADDPQHGRGLCAPCHSSETARHQPGGFASPEM